MQGTPFNSIAVANRFIEFSKADGVSITTMKLLKLVYFAHGWYWGICDKPLLNEQVEAWKFGPVAPNVYHTFKNYESGPITDFGKEVEFRNGIVFQTPMLPNLESLTSFMERIWSIYGKLSAFQLSEMTHQQDTPWYKTWHNMGGSTRKNTDIPDALIQEYFKAKLAA